MADKFDKGFTTLGEGIGSWLAGLIQQHAPEFINEALHDGAQKAFKQWVSDHGIDVDKMATTWGGVTDEVTTDPVTTTEDINDKPAVFADNSFVWTFKSDDKLITVYRGTGLDQDVVAEYPVVQATMVRALVTAHNMAMANERQRFHDLVYVEHQEKLADIDKKLDTAITKTWHLANSQLTPVEGQTTAINVMDEEERVVITFGGHQAGLARRVVQAHNATVLPS